MSPVLASKAETVLSTSIAKTRPEATTGAATAAATTAGRRRHGQHDHARGRDEGIAHQEEKRRTLADMLLEAITGDIREPLVVTAFAETAKEAVLRVSDVFFQAVLGDIPRRVPSTSKWYTGIQYHQPLDPKAPCS